MRILLSAFTALTLLSLAAGAEEGRKIRPLTASEKRSQSSSKIVPLASHVSRVPAHLRKTGQPTAKVAEKSSDKATKGVSKPADKRGKTTKKKEGGRKTADKGK